MKQLILFLTSASAAWLQAQVTGGLTARFQFNGALSDDKGGTAAKAYNCTYVADRQGNSNSAIYIKGLTNSFVNLGTGNNLKPATGSVSIWFNPDEVNNLGNGFDYNPVIVAKNDATAGSFFEAYCVYMKRTDRKGLTITTQKGTSNEKFIWTSSALSLDNWHYAVVCYNSDSLWYYMDNVLQGRIFRGFSQGFDAADSVMLGIVKSSNNNRNYTGAVDDVRIYNRILTAAEVDTLYNMPALRIIDISSRINTAKLYPNPSQGMVYFGSEKAITAYTVSDAGGRIIAEGRDAQFADLTGKQGIFFIEYTDQTGLHYFGKVVIF